MQKPKRKEMKPILWSKHEFERLIEADPGVDCRFIAKTNRREFVQISTAQYQSTAQKEEQIPRNENIQAQHPQHFQVMCEMLQFATTDTKTYRRHLG